MKLLAGIALFLLCALVGEGKSRRLAKRERTLSAFCTLIREIGERQQSALVSFREGALMNSPSPEREALLELAGGRDPDLALLGPGAGRGGADAQGAGLSLRGVSLRRGGPAVGPLICRSRS